MLLTRSQQQGATAWAPISGLGEALIAFWDAENLASIAQSGGQVSSWTDLIAGFAVTQAVSGSKPIYSATSYNNRPGLTFDAADDFLENTAGVGPLQQGDTAGVIDCGVNQTLAGASAGSRCIIAWGNGTAGQQRVLRRVQIVTTNRAIMLDGTISATDTAVDFSGIHTVRGALGGGAGVSISVDGNAATTAAGVTATGSTRARIGAFTGTSPSQFWSGVINNVLIINSAHANWTPANRAALLAWQKNRGGIA